MTRGPGVRFARQVRPVQWARLRRLVRLRRGWAALLISTLLAAVVMGGLPAATGSTPATPWRVGTDPTFPPFELRDSGSGRITGFDVDLIEAIGREAGHPITLVPLPFDGIIPALQQRSARFAGLDLSQLVLNLLRGAGPALLQSLDLGVTIDRLPAAVTALSLNVAAFLAETLRSGIESIPPGQWEAATALGLRPLARMRWVVAPQAIRRVLPSLSNECISLIKDTSLAAVIGFDELFRQGQLMVATSYRAFEIYIAVALVYLMMTTSASWLFQRLEQRLRLPG